MQIIKIDPRALNENSDDARQSKSSAQADALLLATVKAVGIIQPPVVSPQVDGGNGYIIQAGHRRVQAAIAAGLEEIEVLVKEAAEVWVLSSKQNSRWPKDTFLAVKSLSRNSDLSLSDYRNNVVQPLSLTRRCGCFSISRANTCCILNGCWRIDPDE